MNNPMNIGVQSDLNYDYTADDETIVTIDGEPITIDGDRVTIQGAAE